MTTDPIFPFLCKYAVNHAHKTEEYKFKRSNLITSMLVHAVYGMNISCDAVLTGTGDDVYVDARRSYHFWWGVLRCV
jgi:hypothetical protein